MKTLAFFFNMDVRFTLMYQREDRLVVKIFIYSPINSEMKIKIRRIKSTFFLFKTLMHYKSRRKSIHDIFKDTTRKERKKKKNKQILRTNNKNSQSSFQATK